MPRTSNALFEPFAINCEKKPMEINTKDIIVNENAQRDVESRKYQFNKIMREFNPALVQPVKVALLDGKYYCFDGQMTMKVLKAKNKGKDLPVKCEVFLGLTELEAAYLFVQQTGTISAVKLADKLRVLRFYGEPEIVDFCKRTEDNGLLISWHGEKGKYTVTAVSALLKIYRDFGINKNRYDEFVRIICASWNGDPDGLRSQILWGVALFVKEYWNMFETSRLIKRLSMTRPVDIIRDAAVDRSSGNRKYGVQVLQVYNYGLGNKLPNLL